VITRVLLVAWLTLVWVLLWGEASVGNVLAGVVLGLLIVAAFPPADERGGGLHPWAVITFGVWFAKALVIANLSVAREVLRPRLALQEGIVAVPLRSRSPLVATFVANAITLTPGTLTVDVRPAGFGVDEHGDVVESAEPPVLFVHCLVVGDPEQVRAEGLELEERVVRAFGTAEDRSAIEGPAPTWPTASDGGVS
jgi:multicomponent Na+:H+ antiporter subunit E